MDGARRAASTKNLLRDLQRQSSSTSDPAFEPQSLALVRRLPILASGWVYMRFSSSQKSKLDQNVQKVWAEIRGGVLLTSPSDECSLLLSEVDAEDSILAFDLCGWRAKPSRNLSIDLKRKTGSSVKMTIQLQSETDWAKWYSVLSVAVQIGDTSLDDFKIVQKVGEGAYGTVYKVERRGTSEIYAMKEIDKIGLCNDSGAFRRSMDERAILELVNFHPFVLNLDFAFETPSRLFMVTEFCECGDVSEYLTYRARPLSDLRAKCLVAELVLALVHLHSIGVVYRDLKPENVLLDSLGHVRLADFGLGRILENGPMGRAVSICGTRDYMAPEMLTSREGYGQTVDIWSLGILLYYVLVGRTPFMSSDADEVLHLIKTKGIDFPDTLMPKTRLFLENVLVKNPDARLGCSKQGISELLTHPYFDELDWDEISAKQHHGLFAEDDFNYPKVAKQRLKRMAENARMVGRRSLERFRPGTAHPPISANASTNVLTFSKIAGYSYSWDLQNLSGQDELSRPSESGRIRRVLDIFKRR